MVGTGGCVLAELPAAKRRPRAASLGRRSETPREGPRRGPSSIPSPISKLQPTFKPFRQGPHTHPQPPGWETLLPRRLIREEALSGLAK